MDQTDREILGYSRYVVLAAAFSAMFIISPFEYAWSSMSGHIGAIYGWSPEQVAWMFTTFIIFQSVGMLPGGMLRDKYGPRWTTAIAGVFSGVGILSIALGPSYPLVLVLWSVGSFFTGFIYNNAVTTGNKWFADKRGVMTGLIAGAFSWGSLPFIFPIRAIPASAPPETFFTVVYIMAAIIGGVSIVSALLMKDPPSGWKPPGWVPKTKAIARPSEHNYTVSEALKTGQMWVLIVSFILVSSAGLAGLSNMVAYSNGFHFTATAATAAAGGIALANGFGKLTLGTLSAARRREHDDRELHRVRPAPLPHDLRRNESERVAVRLRGDPRDLLLGLALLALPDCHRALFRRSLRRRQLRRALCDSQGLGRPLRRHSFGGSHHPARLSLRHHHCRGDGDRRRIDPHPVEIQPAHLEGRGGGRAAERKGGGRARLSGKPAENQRE